MITIYVPKTGRLDDKFMLLFFFDLMDSLINSDVHPENRYFRRITVSQKQVVPVAMKARVSQNRFLRSPKFHIVRSKSRVVPAGIITVVITSMKQQCPKMGSLQAAIPRCPVGSKKFVDISPGLSQNRSFYLHLTDKGRTSLVQKWNSWSFFVNFGGQR